MKLSFYRDKHLIGIEHLDWATRNKIFSEASTIKEMFKRNEGRMSLQRLLRKDGIPLKIDIIFDKQSFRRRTIFMHTILSLGGQYIASSDEKFSASMAKGEAIEPIVRDLGQRCDGMILRFSKSGAAKRAADICETINAKAKVINAGDAAGDHPIQTLTDLFTIREKKGDTENHSYVFMGDIEKSAAIHSFLIALRKHQPKKIYLASFSGNNILPPNLIKCLPCPVYKIRGSKELENIAPETDIWYVTQYRHCSKQWQEARKIGDWLLNLKKAKRDALFLHPLPYGKEYREGLDLIDSRFLHHSGNDFYITMAILKLMFAQDVDLKIAEAEEKTIEIYGQVAGLEVPIKSITGICAGKTCSGVRIPNGWVKVFSVEEKEMIHKLGKPCVICPECSPNIGKINDSVLYRVIN
jgi:aspartate carbamoyltransferase catalytic subunit